jgi:UDP-2,3-diacylglucosamine pyrophosphatase LpxH
MLSHDQILAALEQAFPRNPAGQPPDGVFLVARLDEPGLSLGDLTPYVFIPDIHLVPGSDAKSFPWVTSQPPQIAGLIRLAGALRALRQTDPSLRVWQLGDCFDLWRTGPMGGAVADDVEATLQAQGPVTNALFNDVGCQLLAGNHDQELLDFQWPGGPQAKNTVMLDRGTSTADVVLAHGHQFDPIETLPRRFKEFFARGATELVPPTPLGMLEVANPHWQPPKVTDPPPEKPGDQDEFLNFDLDPANPLPLAPGPVNVVAYTPPQQDPARAFIDSFGGGGQKPTVDAPRQNFFTDIAWWADQVSADQNKDVRLVVIGHTHHARIVRGNRPRGKRFVLLDCGAWVDSSFLSNKLDAPIANGQIGVKVGNELRIYQLGYSIRT